MTYKEFIDKVKPEFEKSFKFLEGELAKIRTSRASPALVEDIEVNCIWFKIYIKAIGRNFNSINKPNSYSAMGYFLYRANRKGNFAVGIRNVMCC